MSAPLRGESAPAQPAIGQMLPGERRWVLGFAGLALLVSGLPYLVGYAAQGADYRFTGFILGVEDGNTYIAKMLAGSAGSWLFRSPYSPEAQNGILLQMIYLWTGKLAAAPGLHEQLVALYQLLRAVGGLLAILASYDFLAWFVRDVRLRRFGLALVTLGGGLGWLLAALGRNQWLGSLPLDFYSPEAFGFLQLYALPHLALARAAMLWTLVQYLRMASGWVEPGGRVQAGWRAVLRLGGLWLAVGFGQPLTMAITGVVMLAHLAGRRWWRAPRLAEPGGAPEHEPGHAAQPSLARLAAQVALAGVLPGAYLAYSFLITQIDPYIRVYNAQNVIRSPHPLHYLAAYGLALPYAALGLRRLWRGGPQLPGRLVGWLAGGWLALAPFLAYAPLDLQRRMTDGLWAALVGLALAGLAGAHATARRTQPAARGDTPAVEIAPAAAPRPRLNWPAAPLLLAFPSTLLLLLGGLGAAARPALPLFRPAAEVAAFEYLQAGAPVDSLVLAAHLTSNALPAWAPVRVLVGHGPESAHLAELLPQVQRVYGAGPDGWRRDFLRSRGVGYVFYGPEERALGGWDPHTAGYLYRVYQSVGYEVFLMLDQP
ncbi:MAG: hypothetical protein ACKOC5_14320 [Chloroflexota bacterium]